MAPESEPLPTALVTAADHRYYLWQVVVHWVHMRHAGWPARYLVYCGDTRSKLLDAVMETLGADGARFTVWNDWRRRGRRTYNPAMKPGLVGRWLEAHPDERDSPYLLLDPDAIPLSRLRRTIEGDGLRPSPARWFGTDTDSYTGPGYLKSKGEDLWVALCDLVGVDPEQAEGMPGTGSQWLFTGMAGERWLEIAELSEDAYPILQAHKSDVQVWCAEMYVTQLMLVREGIEPAARAPMRMVWGNGAREDWSQAGFYHNAGVVEPGTGHFFKGRFRDRGPFFVEDMQVDDGSASSRYVELIRAAETLWPKLCRRFN